MNINDFKTKWAGRFADNITRDIEESDLREFVNDIAENFFNVDDFEAPSASFSSIEGNATDNASIVALANDIIAAVRGGVDVEYNTLKKLYDHFTAVTSDLQESITLISGGSL